jgi:hypothetical protein
LSGLYGNCYGWNYSDSRNDGFGSQLIKKSSAGGGEFSFSEEPAIHRQAS